MRQWNVNVTKMCNKHLLGEHVEMHAFVGCIKKGTSMKGYIDNGLVEIENISKRHNELVKEMEKRNMKHKTEIEDTHDLFGGKIDIKKNELILKERCKECKF